MNNNNNHKNMGDEFMDGLGSSINDAMKIARATGLDKQMNKDIKNLKGYSDSEIASMDLQELKSAKKQSKKMFVCGIMFAVIIIFGCLGTTFNESGTNILPLAIFAIIPALFARKHYKKCKIIESRIHEYYK